MSTFDYENSKEMALRLVEKFGTDCKIISPTKTSKAKCVFMSNTKQDRLDGPQQTQTKQVYVVGVNVDINTNFRLEHKNTAFLITNTELYNFDGNTKVLYVLTVAK